MIMLLQIETNSFFFVWELWQHFSTIAGLFTSDFGRANRQPDKQKSSSVGRPVEFAQLPILERNQNGGKNENRT